MLVIKDPFTKFCENCSKPNFEKMMSCMVWGSIGLGYKSKLIFWDHETHDTTTAKGYTLPFCLK